MPCDFKFCTKYVIKQIFGGKFQEKIDHSQKLKPFTNWKYLIRIYSYILVNVLTREEVLEGHVQAGKLYIEKITFGKLSI